MKRIVKRNIFSAGICLLLALVLTVAGGCTDDLLYDRDDYEGDGSIRMSINFEPLNAVDMSTRTPGDAIHDIESLSIVFFNTDGVCKKIVNQGDPEIQDWVLEQNGNSSMPTGAGQQAEATTPRATFRLVNLDIPFGTYHIYAVANMGELTSSASDPLTEAKLKSTLLTWNPTEIGKNNQMFGYFTSVANAGDLSGMPSGFGPQPISIKENTSPRLHSWLRRAASKVTVAFDGADLNDDVRVYINKVTIRDIPRTCLLGEYNKPASTADLIAEGGSLYYTDNGIIPADQASSDYNSWLKITNDDKDPVGSNHSETAEALFFYENMQGDYSQRSDKEKFDKKQSGSPALGVLVDPGDPDYKDEVPYGTWIEVEGHYESDNPANLGSGKIIYRFMLGKDVDYNYDAERNHHFKLTLKFNGWANQADWHIEYTQEDPAIITPSDFYMPYLYNQKAMYPLTLNGDVQTLKVEIIENGWAPVSPITHEIPAQTVGDFTWNRPAYNVLGPVNYAQLGFLALAVPNDTGEPATNVVPQTNANRTNRELARQELNTLYTQQNTAPGGYTWSQKYREYDVSPGTHQDGNNEYTVTKAAVGDSYSVQIPLWTRNKTMIENSGFTGNNPYEAYERKAIIKITATFNVTNPDGSKELRELTEEKTIYQTRRIVNPKGVWRSYSDNESFYVHLATMNSPTDSKYSWLRSEGSWYAYIEDGDKTFCNLVPKGETEAQDIIYGDTDSEIEFSIGFNGSVTSGNSKGCIVSVVYNGGSCVHKILVRQGYDEAVAIVDGGAKWSSFNLYACESGHNGEAYSATSYVNAEVTCNPLSVGSLFKRRNYSDAILVTNNNTYGPLVALNGGSLVVKSMGGANRSLTWDNITAYPATEPLQGNGYFTVDVINANTSTRWARFRATPPGSSTAKTYRVPSYADYQALNNAEYAVGVLYADDGNTTLDTFDAYGYEDGTNTLRRSPNGMRGYIVYNKTSGAQIFFPIGKYGMARRTQVQLDNNNNNNSGQRGYLRYAGIQNVLTGEGNYWRPIPYDMPSCPGSIYWIDIPMVGTQYHTDGACSGWDMNYFSLDFSSYNYLLLNDAGPVKLILDE